MNSDHAPTAEEQLPEPTPEQLSDAWRWIQCAVEPERPDYASRRDEVVAMIATAFLAQRQLLAALRENREKDDRIAELEKANAKIPKMYVWGTGRQGFYATAQAYSVAEARELLLEETGTTDGSCPIRALAIDAIRNENPTIFYRSNAQFTLTDSAELEEMDAYAETLRNRAEAAEAKLRAVSDALDEKLVAVFHVGELEYYLRSEIDVPLARIRTIVEGK